MAILIPVTVVGVGIVVAVLYIRKKRNMKNAKDPKLRTSETVSLKDFKPQVLSNDNNNSRESSIVDDEPKHKPNKKKSNHKIHPMPQHLVNSSKESSLSHGPSQPNGANKVSSS